MSKKIDGGFAIVKTLKEFGIENIFTLAVGHINPIYNACKEMGIRLIDCHHEQAASMAADAYGRVTKSPGVCLVTAGPGLTNVITGTLSIDISFKLRAIASACPLSSASKPG